MKLIKDKTKTPFTLALDLNNEKTGRYSSKKGEFTGYVIDASGTITGIFDGNKRDRAKSKQLLEAISAGSADSDSTKEGSDTKKAGSESKADTANKAGSESKDSGSK